MGPGGSPQGFCGLKPEQRPAEAYFAVEGDEEKLPPDDVEVGIGGGDGRKVVRRRALGDHRASGPKSRHRGGAEGRE